MQRLSDILGEALSIAEEVDMMMTRERSNQVIQHNARVRQTNTPQHDARPKQ